MVHDELASFASWSARLPRFNVSSPSLLHGKLFFLSTDELAYVDHGVPHSFGSW